MADEQKVASTIVARRSNDQIASKPDISMKSLQSWRTSLVKKLDPKALAGLGAHCRVDDEHAATSCPTPNPGSKFTNELEPPPN